MPSCRNDSETIHRIEVHRAKKIANLLILPHHFFAIFRLKRELLGKKWCFLCVLEAGQDQDMPEILSRDICHLAALAFRLDDAMVVDPMAHVLLGRIFLWKHIDPEVFDV